jgi:hypothetical protein
MDNFRRLDTNARQQAWGVAFRRGEHLSWRYGEGPCGYKTWTWRAAKLVAFMSNNEREGPFVAIPVPDCFASMDIDESAFDPGPIGDDRAAIARAFRVRLLRSDCCRSCNGPRNYSLDGKLQEQCYACAHGLDVRERIAGMFDHAER